VASKAADRPCPRKVVKPPAPEPPKPKAKVEAKVEAPVQAKKVRQPLPALPPAKKSKNEVKKVSRHAEVALFAQLIAVGGGKKCRAGLFVIGSKGLSWSTARMKKLSTT
jgi:hypothetical protein